jgi:superfamily II DNA or RNA helicase
MKLRPYQGLAVDCIFEEWKTNDSTLLVLPTGCGKTQVFSECIRRIHPGRSLVLAHRSELIHQAVKRIESAGIECSIEMAELRASSSFWNRTPCVVSSIQTQVHGDGARLTRFKPEDFDLVVIDEAHHATAASYRKVVDYYRQNPKLRILGVTATPDRADEQALGEVFKTVAFDYEILDAIHDGWLVPITQQMVEIEGLDFSHIRTTCGDLNGADLAQVMEQEKNLQGIASASIAIIGTRRTIVFAASVKQAEILCDIFNRYQPDMAAWVCGKTPKDDREQMLRKFNDGQIQVMVNVGVLTEGFDSPAVEVIVQARPTKSRCLYSQMIGRATRPLPGTVDGDGKELPETRREHIAASSKPVCLVVDFAGNAGRHKLVTTADILGGKSSEEAIERAKKKATASGKPEDMAALIDEEEQNLKEEDEERKRREAARKAHLIGKARFSVKTINPFDLWDMTPARERGWDAGKHLSEKQTALLLKQGIDPAGMPYAQAKQVLNQLFYRWSAKLATLKQCNTVKRFYPETDTAHLTMANATKMIDAVAQNGWKRPAAPVAVTEDVGF